MEDWMDDAKCCSGLVDYNKKIARKIEKQNTDIYLFRKLSCIHK